MRRGGGGRGGVAPLVSPLAQPAAPDVLHVEVQTGNVRGGGCSSPAALTLYGDEGARAAKVSAGEPLTPLLPALRREC